MARYRISEDMVQRALREPDAILQGHSGRLIAQKALNGYLLRVIYERNEGLSVVVTVYRARRDRYEI